LNSTAPGTVGILLVTCIVSLFGLYGRPQLIEKSLFRPYEVVRKSRYYTLVSSGLVHGSFTHLLFNMLTFYFFGPPLERVVGTVQFVILYLVGMILSEVRTYLQHRNDPRYAALGASGAVSAVLFASIVIFPQQSIFILPLPVPIPAPLFAIGYLVYSWYLSRHARDGVNHTAHIDGAVTGLVFVALLYPQAYGRLLAIYH
jgi:membrane associated rhomboid family serine protease